MVAEKSAPSHDNSIQDDEVGIFCTHDVFKEHEAVNILIDSIKNTVQSDIKAEKDFEQMKTILDEYQEQPHLLDPYLEELLDKLISLVRDIENSNAILCQAFKYLYLFTKVRGYKTIVKKLPHEVKDLMPVLVLLENKEIQVDFYSTYVLLMWLSIIVYMPFNMDRFDDTSIINPTDQKKITVVDRVMDVIKLQLRSSDNSREMAAYLASKFFTRPDLRDEHLPNFIDYCFEVLKNSKVNDHPTICSKLGVLRALGLIFKHGKREELLPYSEDVLNKLIELNSSASEQTPIRKYSIKLIQRIGLSFLKPRLASWRYQMGTRSLNINVNAPKSGTHNKWEKVAQEDDDDEEISGPLEEIVEKLLLGLKDSDTIVRWSSAKGIGRITGRLPKELADDIVGAILDMFSAGETDKAWHGGCLALAELARRSLLLPDRLPEVIPILERAFVYDEQRGQTSVGSNIRDAACYLSWAFARAYQPSQLEKYVDRIAIGLLIVALFDREIPCRRAGSAAFQEHVGRQGSFPHGIKILTTVDYYAVGIRSNAYLKLSMDVAKYPNYTIPLIDHLVDKKINHWDSAIRDLAAKALQNLSMLDVNYMANNILPKVLQLTNSQVLIVRHGSIVATGHIVYGIALAAQKENKLVTDYINTDLMQQVEDIVPKLEEKKLFRGMGGEYMKQASCVLIEKCSLSMMPFAGKPILDTWFKLLEECVVYVDENIRIAALEGLPALWNAYYVPLTPNLEPYRNQLIERCIENLKGNQEIKNVGSAAALGCLPSALLKGKFDVVLDHLLSSVIIRPDVASWALSRKVAILSMIKCIESVGVCAEGSPTDHLCEKNIKSVYNTLFTAMDDYTMDRRGDIGAWVREAAMNALEKLTDLVIKECPQLIDEEISTEMMTRICQQAVERIDRTRKVAGNAFASLLYRESPVPHIPNRKEVEKIFPYSEIKYMNWSSEKKTFCRFVLLLDFDDYRMKLLKGLSYSIGGMTANLARYASEALCSYLNKNSKNEDKMRTMILTILDIFTNYEKQDRVTLPLLKCYADIMSSSMALDIILENDKELLTRLMNCVKKECARCTDFYKLSASVNVLCEFLRLNTPLTRNIFIQLSIYLGYQYPKVRAVTATSLLTAVQEYCSDNESIPEENIEEVVTLLEETEWMESLEEARKQRNRFCVLVGVPYPTPKNPVT